MREIALGPGDWLRLAVEQDNIGTRVLLRIGNGRWRPISAAKARAAGELFIQAADEVDVAQGRCICQGLTHRPQCPEHEICL